MSSQYPIAGVYPKEKDISETVEVAGVNAAGLVLKASQGRINALVSVSTSKKLTDYFGRPVFTGASKEPDYGYGLYAANEYLKVSNQLTVVRVATANDYYAAVSLAKTSPDEYDYDYDYETLEGNGGTLGFVANPFAVDPTYSNVLNTVTSIKDIEEATATGSEKILISCVGPGKYGNNIAVGVEFYSSTASWKYYYDESDDIDAFDADGNAISKLDKLENLVAPKVFKLSVYLKSDKQVWGLTAPELADEEYLVSTSNVVDSNGKSLYITDVINGASENIYIRQTASVTDAELIDNLGESVFSALTGGVSYVSKDTTGTSSGWDFFANKELIDVNLLIVPTYDTTTKQYVNQTIINARKRDCMMVGQSGTVENLTVETIKAAEAYGYSNSSYVGLYAGYGKIKDTYNDKFVYLPNSIFGAVAIANTANVATVAFAPAGDARATVSAIEQNVVLDDGMIGELNAVNINCVKQFSGKGAVIWGQATAQRRETSLNRINVRRTMLFIENTINKFFDGVVFNFNNTSSTRSRLLTVNQRFLDGLKASEDIYDGKIEIDYVPGGDEKELKVNVFVAPTSAIEYIPITYVITRTGVNFSEIKI